MPFVTIPSDLIHNLFKSVPIQPWPSHLKLLFGPFVLPSSWSNVTKLNIPLSFTGSGQFDAGVGASIGVAGACAETDIAPKLASKAPVKTSWRARRAIMTPPPYETSLHPCGKADDNGKPSVRVCLRLRDSSPAQQA